MTTNRAIIDVEINTSPAAANLRSLQAQLNAFQSALNKGNLVQGAAAKEYARSLSALVNSSGYFTAETVRMRTAAGALDETLRKGQGTIGQYFNSLKKGSAAFNAVNSLAQARAATLQTQFIATGAAARGFQDALAIRPLQAFNDAAAVSAQRMAIQRAMFNQATTSMINFGKNVQWAGRQLMVGFTIPLTIIGAIAAKTFSNLEKQLINLEKVYGDAFTAPGELESAVGAVKELGMELTKYGIKLQDTVKLAADAAAAGNKAGDLLNVTREATRLSVLGQVEQQKAFETTIALQSAFGVSTENLAESINFMNMVENQTVLSLEDMAEALPRVAPVIKGLGGDVKDMAVLLAAMKEGGISAAQGANALKSGLASLINPTSKAVEALDSMGINLNRIIQANRGDLMGTVRAFGEALNTVDEFTRQQAIEKVFGKYQFARLNALFTNITKDGTQAARAMELAGMSAGDLAQSAEKELAAIEASPVNKLTKSIEQLKLSLVPVGEAFAKVAAPIAEIFTRLFQNINNLPDFVKKIGAIATVLIGLVIPAGTMFLGLLMNLTGTILKFANVFRVGFQGLVRGGLSGAIKAVSEMFKYMSLAEIEATLAAEQLERASVEVDAALRRQAGGAGNARAAIETLTASYTRLIARMQEAAAMSGVFAVPAAAMGNAARGAQAAQRVRYRNKGGAIYLSEGGSPRVPGVGNTDTVPAMLTPGEFVVNKQATQQNLPLLQAINDGKAQGLNRGGGVAKYGRLAYGPPPGRPVKAPEPWLAQALRAQEAAEAGITLGGRSRAAATRTSGAENAHFGSHILNPSQAERLGILKGRNSKVALGVELVRAGVPVTALTDDWATVTRKLNQAANRNQNEVISVRQAVQELKLGKETIFPRQVGPAIQRAGVGSDDLVDLMIAKLSKLPNQDARFTDRIFTNARNDAFQDFGAKVYPTVTGLRIPTKADLQEFVGAQRGLDSLQSRAQIREMDIARELAKRGFRFEDGRIISTSSGTAKMTGESSPYAGSTNIQVFANKGGMIPGVQYFAASMKQRIVQRARDIAARGAYGGASWQTRGGATNAVMNEYIRSLPPAQRIYAAREFEKFSANLTRREARTAKTVETKHLLNKDLDAALAKRGLPPISAFYEQLGVKTHATHLTRARVVRGRRYVSRYVAEYDALSNLQANQGSLLINDFIARNLSGNRMGKYDKIIDAAFKKRGISATERKALESQIDAAIRKRLRSEKKARTISDDPASGSITFESAIKPIIDREIMNAGGSKTALQKLSARNVIRKNKGGFIPGSFMSPTLMANQGNIVPGVGNTDTVPAMLTPGEFVVNKQATSENLPVLKAINDGVSVGSMVSGGIQKFVKGGRVKRVGGQWVATYDGDNLGKYATRAEARAAIREWKAMVRQDKADQAAQKKQQKIERRAARKGMTADDYQRSREASAQKRAMGRQAAGGVLGMASMAPLFMADPETGKFMGQNANAMMGGLMAASMMLTLPPKMAIGLAAVAAPLAAFTLAVKKSREELDKATEASYKMGINLGGSADRMEQVSQATGYVFSGQKAKDKMFRFTGEEKSRMYEFSEYFESDRGKAYIKEIQQLTSEERYAKIASELSFAIADGMDPKDAKAYGVAIAAYAGDAFLKQRIVRDFNNRKYIDSPETMTRLVQQRDEQMRGMQLGRPYTQPDQIGQGWIGTQAARAMGQQGVNATYGDVVAAGAIGAGAAMLTGAAVGAAIGSAVPVVGTIIIGAIGALIGGAIGWMASNATREDLLQNTEIAAMNMGASTQILKEVNNAEAKLLELRRKGAITTEKYAQEEAKLREIKNRAAESFQEAVSVIAMGGGDIEAVVGQVKSQLVLAGYGGDTAEAIARTTDFDTIAKQIYGTEIDIQAVKDDPERKRVVEAAITQIFAGMTPENAGQQIARVTEAARDFAAHVENGVIDAIEMEFSDFEAAINASALGSAMQQAFAFASPEDAITNQKDIVAEDILRLVRTGERVVEKDEETGETFTYIQGPDGTRIRTQDAMDQWEKTKGGLTPEFIVNTLGAAGLPATDWDAGRVEELLRDPSSGLFNPGIQALVKGDIAEAQTLPGGDWRKDLGSWMAQSPETAQYMLDEFKRMAEEDKAGFAELFKVPEGDEKAIKDILDQIQMIFELSSTRTIPSRVGLVFAGVSTEAERAGVAMEEWATKNEAAILSVGVNASQLASALSSMDNLDVLKKVARGSDEVKLSFAGLVAQLSDAKYAAIDLDSATGAMLKLGLGAEDTRKQIDGFFKYAERQQKKFIDKFGKDTGGLMKQYFADASEQINAYYDAITQGTLDSNIKSFDQFYNQVSQAYADMIDRLSKSDSINKKNKKIKIDSQVVVDIFGTQVSDPAAFANVLNSVAGGKQLDPANLEVLASLRFTNPEAWALLAQFGMDPIAAQSLLNTLKADPNATSYSTGQEEVITFRRSGQTLTRQATTEITPALRLLGNAINEALFGGDETNLNPGDGPSTTGGGGSEQDPVKDFRAALLEKLKLYTDLPKLLEKMKNKKKDIESLLTKISFSNTLAQEMRKANLNETLIAMILSQGYENALKIWNSIKSNVQKTNLSFAKGDLGQRVEALRSQAQTDRNRGRVEAGLRRDGRLNDEQIAEVLEDDDLVNLLATVKVGGKAWREYTDAVLAAAAANQEAEESAKSASDKHKEMMDLVNAEFEAKFAENALQANLKFAASYGKTAEQMRMEVAEREDLIDGYREEIYSIEQVIKELERRRGVDNDINTWGLERLQRRVDEINQEIRGLERLNELDQRRIADLQRQDEMRNRQAAVIQHDLDIMSDQEDKIRESYEKRIEALDQVAKINEHILNQQKSQINLSKALTEGDVYAAALARQEMQAASVQYAQDQTRAGLEQGMENQISGLRTSSGMTREQSEERLRQYKEQSYQTTLLINQIEEQIYNRTQTQILPLKDQQYNLESAIQKVNNDILVQQDAILKIERDKIEPAQRLNDLDNERLDDLTLEIDKQNSLETVAGQTKDQWELISANVAANLEFLELQKKDTTGLAQRAENLANAWKTVGDNIRRAYRAMTKEVEDVKKIPITADYTVEDREEAIRAIRQKYQDMMTIEFNTAQSQIGTNAQLPTAPDTAPAPDTTPAPAPESRPESNRSPGGSSGSGGSGSSTPSKPPRRVVSTTSYYQDGYVWEKIEYSDGKIEKKRTNKQAPVKDVRMVSMNGIVYERTTLVDGFVIDRPKARIGVTRPGESSSWKRTDYTRLQLPIPEPGSYKNFNGAIHKFDGYAWKLGFATGGLVNGEGARDSVRAMLTPGEFVVRKPAVAKYGQSMFEKINMGAFQMPRYNINRETPSAVSVTDTRANISAPVYNTYSINVPVTQPGASADEIANKVMTKIRNVESASIRRVNGY